MEIRYFIVIDRPLNSICPFQGLLILTNIDVTFLKRILGEPPYTGLTVMRSKNASFGNQSCVNDRLFT